MTPLSRLKELTLRDHLLALWKRKFLILFLALFLGAYGAFSEFRSPDVYKAEARILIANPGQDVPLLELLNSQALAGRVVKSLELEEDPEELLHSVKGTLRENKNIVSIEVTGEDKDAVREIADVWAKEFVELVLKKDAGFSKTAGIHMLSSGKAVVLPKGRETARFFVLGLLIGVLISIAKEYLDTTIKRPREVERYGRMLLLGYVPPREEGRGSERELDMISILRPDSIQAEAFRNIKASFLLAIPDGADPRTILVTSSVPSEGRTFISANLAENLARPGEKTLLIETDTEKPRLGESLAVEERLDSTIYGLSDLLAGAVTLDEAISRTPVEGLYFLGSGNLRPSETSPMGRRKFVELIRHLRSLFDKVIVDSSPVLVGDSALVLARVCDGIVFVIGAEVATERNVADARRKLQDNTRKILGAVLNGTGTGKGLQEYLPEFRALIRKMPGMPGETEEQRSEGEK